MNAQTIFLIAAFSTATFFTAKANNSNFHPRHEEGINFQVFYDELSPFGDWIDYPGYGYAWHPSGAEFKDFRPYLTGGRWLSTNDGFAWDSDYDWGWAPFHYGSWFYDDVYGWLWLPGYQWAPAWVTWGYYDGFYGWAPIAPFWDLDYAYSDYRPIGLYWNYVPCKNLLDHDLRQSARANDSERIRWSDNVAIIDNFHADQRNGVHFNKGPRLSEVRRYTGHRVVPMVLAESDHPGKAIEGKRHHLSVYRPGVEQTEGKVLQPEHFQKPEATNPKGVVVRSHNSPVFKNGQGVENSWGQEIETHQRYRSREQQHNGTQTSRRESESSPPIGRNGGMQPVPTRSHRPAATGYPAGSRGRNETTRRIEPQQMGAPRTLPEIPYQPQPVPHKRKGGDRQ